MTKFDEVGGLVVLLRALGVFEGVGMRLKVRDSWKGRGREEAGYEAASIRTSVLTLSRVEQRIREILENEGDVIFTN